MTVIAKKNFMCGKEDYIWVSNSCGGVNRKTWKLIYIRRPESKFEKSTQTKGEGGNRASEKSEKPFTA